MNLYRKTRKLLSPLKGKYQEIKYNLLFQKTGSRNLDLNKKVYYIIRRYPREAGFFSNYLCVLSHMAYAKEKGYVSVVDMEHYPTYYNEKSVINGSKNAWEYYFLQPEGASLKEAYHSGNYILSSSGFQKSGMKLRKDMYSFPLEKEVGYYYALCRSIRFIPALEKELKKEEQIFWNKKKVLGVHVRATDMQWGGFAGHPKTAELPDYLNMAERFLQEDRDIDTIFLATDEEKIKEAFKKHFGSKVYMTEAFRAKEHCNMGIHYGESADRKHHHYLLGKEVIKDAYLLSKCNKIICGLSNVATAAIIWNNNQYEKIGVLCEKKIAEKITKAIEQEEIAKGRYSVAE